MMAEHNEAWSLEGFLDALVVELDRAQDTLAVKAINRPLTYSVKDVDLELQIFPTYEGEQVRFRTAQPGDSGSSRISLQLASITDRMVRETTRAPQAGESIGDAIEEVDEDTIRSLEKIGVKSVQDLERVQERDVNLQRVGSKKISFGKLADVINRSRRRSYPPQVFAVGMSNTPTGDCLSIEGRNLTAVEFEDGFPAARLDGKPVPVEPLDNSELRLRVDRSQLAGDGQRLEIALDRYTVLNLDLNLDLKAVT